MIMAAKSARGRRTLGTRAAPNPVTASGRASVATILAVVGLVALASVGTGGGAGLLLVCHAAPLLAGQAKLEKGRGRVQIIDSGGTARTGIGAEAVEGNAHLFVNKVSWQNEHVSMCVQSAWNPRQ